MMKRFALLFVIALYGILFSSQLGPNKCCDYKRGNSKIKNFRQAKRILGKLYAGDYSIAFLTPKTIYCNCRFRGRSLDVVSCGYKPYRAVLKSGKKNRRAYTIEWEHIVPAHVFGRHFPGWQRKKSFKTCKSLSNRQCAYKIHHAFRTMEADLYNIFPAIGEINAMRSNYPMAQIPGEKRRFGTCDIEIESRTIEPRQSVRGDIARIYFYMDWAYPGYQIVTDTNQALLQQWSRDDPISAEELLRAKKIMSIQGTCNPFVLPCYEL